MSRLAIVKLHSDELKFSSGHFMLFSADKRESLHGHDYQVSLTLHTQITQNGMSFDSRAYKEKLRNLCLRLDYRFLLPTQSAFLKIEETSDTWIAHFNQETIRFAKQDAVLLPITNATLEELSNWFLLELLNDKKQLQDDCIQSLSVTVCNGRGDSGTTQSDTLSY